MKAIYPVTITSKLKESSRFYCDLFDFEPVFEADWYIQLVHKDSGVESRNGDRATSCCATQAVRM